MNYEYWQTVLAALDAAMSTIVMDARSSPLPDDEAATLEVVVGGISKGRQAVRDLAHAHPRGALRLISSPHQDRLAL